MEHVSSHPAICTNVFKNGDATTSKAAFTRKWIEMINRIEKNKQLQYGHLSRVNAQKSKNNFQEARMRAISSRKSCSEHR